jgi:glycerate kinase
VRILIAPDKFKGTLSAAEVASAIASGLKGHVAAVVPMADGGDGTLEVLADRYIRVPVVGPSREELTARLGLAHDGTVIVEAAEACGLRLVGKGAAGPTERTTYGVGQLILAAWHQAPKRVLVGIGGTSTTDGGLGALIALGACLRGGLQPPVSTYVAYDSEVSFTASARVFGPQKGASPEEVALLERRLKLLRTLYSRLFQRDPEVKGGGAGGGLAGGIWAATGAPLMKGAELIASLKGLGRHIAQADIVVTAEGRFDETSLSGKVTGTVIQMALAHAKPVVVVAASFDGTPLPPGVTVVAPAGRPDRRLGRRDISRLVRERLGVLLRQRP